MVKMSKARGTADGQAQAVAMIGQAWNYQFDPWKASGDEHGEEH
jgi:hypothetical protein